MMKNITLPSGKQWFQIKELVVGKSPIAEKFNPFSLFSKEAHDDNPYETWHMRQLIEKLKETKTSKLTRLSTETELERDQLTYAIFRKIAEHHHEAHLAFLLEIPKVIPTRYNRVFRKLIIKFPYEGISWSKLRSECVDNGYDVEEAAIIERTQATDTETILYWTTTDMSHLDDEDQNFVLIHFSKVA